MNPFIPKTGDDNRVMKRTYEIMFAIMVLDLTPINDEKKIKVHEARC